MRLSVLATPFLLLALAGAPPAAAGEARYIRDILTIGLRSAPRPDADIVKALKSGDTVEVLGEEGQYARVRVPGNGEGYISKQHLTTDPPLSIRVGRAEADTTRLTEALAKSEAERAKLEAALAETKNLSGADPEAVKKAVADAKGEAARLGRELQAAKAAYEDLRQKSGQVLEISAERDRLAGEAEAARAEAASSSAGGKIKWFFAGAAVLAAGFLLGRTPGGKKRNRLEF